MRFIRILYYVCIYIIAVRASEVVDCENDVSTIVNEKILYFYILSQRPGLWCCFYHSYFLYRIFTFCSQRGSDEMVTSPGVEGGPVSNGDTNGTNHVDNNNDAKKVKTKIYLSCYSWICSVTLKYIKSYLIFVSSKYWN